MSLTDQFTKRTEDVVEEEGSFAGYIEKGGPYLVTVTDAYDSNVVYPDDDTRHIGLTVEVVKPILDKQIGETDKEFEDRMNEKGKISRVRMYLSDKTAKTVLGLLGGISGSMSFSQSFDEKARQKDEKGNPVTNSEGKPVYDFEYVAEKAPINPENLIGRKFFAYFEYDEYKDRQDMNMFDSSAISDEDKQEEPPVGLFDGEDTHSKEVKEKIEEGQGNDRDKLMDEDEDEDSLDPNDELPF